MLAAQSISSDAPGHEPITSTKAALIYQTAFLLHQQTELERLLLHSKVPYATLDKTSAKCTGGYTLNWHFLICFCKHGCTSRPETTTMEHQSLTNKKGWSYLCQQGTILTKLFWGEFYRSFDLKGLIITRTELGDYFSKAGRAKMRTMWVISNAAEIHLEYGFQKNKNKINFSNN